MKLEEFKARQLARVIELKNELETKYTNNVDRVRELVDLIMIKIDNLNAYTLSDYLFTLYLCSKEFPEFATLIPSEETIEELLKGEEE